MGRQQRRARRMSLYEVLESRMMLSVGPLNDAAPLPAAGQNVAISKDLFTYVRDPSSAQGSPDASPPIGLRPYGSSSDSTSEYMSGSVYVTVVVMESDGSIDPSTENWSLARINEVKAEITEGLTWWEDMYTLQGYTSPLSFTIDFTYADSPVATGYEPITRTQPEEMFWIDDFLAQEGYSGGYTDAKLYNDDVRIANNTDWAYTIFVVDSNNDADGMFADGYFAYAYLGGPFVVMTYDNDGWGIGNMGQVTAHETGHIFWAFDEYPGSGSYYFDHSGYYNTQNLNAFDFNPNPNNRVDSIMAEANLQDNAYANHTSSPTSLQMIGWKDSDADSIINVLDIPLTLSGNGALDPATQSFTFIGASAVRTLTNANPWSSGDNITLNEVDHLQYSIDLGPWINADDFGVFSTTINTTISSIPGGSSSLRIRTISDDSGSTSAIRSFPLSWPDLRPSNLGANRSTVAQMKPLGMTVQVSNIGPVAQTADWTVEYYLSTDTTIDGTDYLLGSSTFSADIAPGTFVNVPIQTWTVDMAVPVGTYYAGVRVVNVGGDGSDLNDTTYLVAPQIQVTPFNAPPVLNPIGNKSVDELTLLQFTASASDATLPAQTLAFDLVGAPTGAAIDASTGVFTWTPTEAQGPGTYTFAVRVTDSGGESTQETINVTVNEINVPPTLDPIGSKTVNELALLTFTAGGHDPDLFPLVYSLTGAPAGAAINAATGVFTWTPTEAQGPGTYSFKVIVTDSALVTAEQTVDVTVQEVNVAPVLATIGNKAAAEHAALTFQASAADPDNLETLTYSLIGAPAGAAINSATGDFAWTPSELQGGGSYTFTVRVQDNGAGALMDEETITVNVAEVNDLPVLAAIGNKTVWERLPMTFTASAADSDVPVQTVAYSLINAPSGAAIDATTGAFTWTPTDAQGPGVFTFTIRATDSGSPAQFDEETIVVTVNEMLAPLADKTVDEGSLLAFTAVGSDLLVNRSYSLVGAPSGAQINATTGAFTWTPTEAQGPGVYTFAVRVSGDGAADQKDLTVTVNRVNDTPTLTYVAPLTGAMANKPYSITYSQLLGASNAADLDTEDHLVFLVEALGVGTLTDSSGNAVGVGSVIDSGQTLLYTPPDGTTGLRNAFSVKVRDPQMAVSLVSTPVQVETAKFLGAFGATAGGSRKLTLADSNGTVATLSLAGSGMAELYDDVGGWTVLLSGTSAASSLTVSARGGHGQVNIKNVIVSSLNSLASLKSFSGPAVNLVGDLLVPGTLSALTVGSMQPGGRVEINNWQMPVPAGLGLTIKSGLIDQRQIDTHNLPIKSLTAARWTGGSLTAPSVGTLSIKGDLRDATFDLMTMGDYNGVAINKATIGGLLSGTTVKTRGKINTFSAGGASDSKLAVGLLAGDSLPASAGEFYGSFNPSIGKLTITGKAKNGGGSSLAGFEVAAPSILSANFSAGHVADPRPATKLVTRSLVAFKFMDEAGSYAWTNGRPMTPDPSNDWTVSLV